MKTFGIVTFNDAFNYGAFLQEYALQKYLRFNNFQAEVISYQNDDFEQLYKYCNNLFKRNGLQNKLRILYNMILRPSVYKARLNKNKKFQQCYEQEIIFSDNFSDCKVDIEEYYDAFIAGSDQVWNVRMTCYNLFYLLDFVKDSKKKLSYAASFGRTEFDEGDYEIFKKYIGDFNSVLVREKSGSDLLIDKCDIASKVVLDPTFLLKADDWKEFAKNSSLKKPLKKYILIYVVSLPTNMYKAAIRYADERNFDIILLGRNSDIVIDGRRLRAFIDVGPYEFIDYVLHAEAVFTTSFHGTILAINMGKRFFFELCREKYNNNARLVDIIEMLGLGQQEITADVVNNQDIPWKKVHEKLNGARLQSEKLLLDSLNNI